MKLMMPKNKMLIIAALVFQLAPSAFASDAPCTVNAPGLTQLLSKHADILKELDGELASMGCEFTQENHAKYELSVYYQWAYCNANRTRLDSDVIRLLGAGRWPK